MAVKVQGLRVWCFVIYSFAAEGLGFRGSGFLGLAYRLDAAPRPPNHPTKNRV